MPSYKKSEAREWARERLIGVANVTIPTITSDMKGINEKAIRHDVAKTIEDGFIGSLMVSEVVISMDEYVQCLEFAHDEAKGRLIMVHHAMFNNLQENIEAVKRAESAGCELVLLCYPPYFFPKTTQEIYEYTKTICDATNLAVMIFAVPTWGFSRFHPADLEVALMRRLIDDCPNISVIKAEGGRPHIMGLIEAHRHFHKEVVISSPIEWEYIPLAQVIPIPFCGTNFSAYYGPLMPRIHKMIQAGELDEATQWFYKMEPARKAFSASNPGGPGLSNRTVWKFQSWLQGYNGGPLRHPTMRVQEGHMNMLRKGLEASGLYCTDSPNEDFFVGRNPA